MSERKQNNVHHKEKKTKHAVLCYWVISQITLAAPRLGAEEGVGKTTKKNEHEKPTVPCLCLAARFYPDHGPVLSGGVGGTEEKQTDEQKGPPRAQH